MKVSLCAEGSESEKRVRRGCACATERSDFVSVTLLTIKEFSLLEDDSGALLLIIRLNRNK